MYLAGVSVRRVEDITDALWGTRVSSSAVSELNQQIYEKIESWRMKPIQGDHPYICRWDLFETQLGLFGKKQNQLWRNYWRRIWMGLQNL